MATLDSIFYPSGEDATGTVAGTTASAEIPIGKNRIFALIADQDCHIKFGGSGLSAASTSNFKLFSGIIARFDMGDVVQSLSIYNPGSTTLNYYIMYLTR